MLSMQRAMRDKRENGSKAFTLTELLIVILIIAVLLALTLPRFFAARRSAGDRVAQQTLQIAARSAAALATDTESYSSAGVTELEATEPDITFVSGALPTPTGNSRAVSVAATANTWTGAAWGAEERCWLVRMTFELDAGVPQATEYGLADGVTACNAGTPPGTTTWQEREFPPGN